MLATFFSQSIWTSVLLFFAATAASQCNVTWLYPPAGLTINYNDTIFASWTSTCPQPALLVWGPSSDNSAQVLWDQSVVSTNGTSSFSFINGIRFRSVWPFPAHFEIEYNETADYYGVDGAVFSITSTTGMPTTYALSTTYAALSSSTTSGKATFTGTTMANSQIEASPTSPLGVTANATSPSTSSATSATPGWDIGHGEASPGTSQRVGIGVGVGVGVLVCIIGPWIYSRWSKKKKRQYASVSGHGGPEMIEKRNTLGEKQERHELQSPQEFYELGSESTPHELHGISSLDAETSARKKSGY